ncbi:MAG: DMT family transporter [Nitrospirota bacterium]
MNVHVTTGRWRLGLALSMVTALMWGILPVALKVLLDYMDAFTVTWYRFFGAAVLMSAFVIRRNSIPPLNKLRKSVISLLLVASAGLCSNYIFYAVGLDHLPPSTATIVIQMATVFLLFGSLLIFRERFSTGQWAGFLVLLIGLALFFNDRINELFSRLGEFTTGVLFILAAALLWSVYALAQKQLLKSFRSETVMLFIFISGALLFFPFARPSIVLNLDGPGFLLLGFCSINTFIAYGSFAEALDHLEASRVSMIVATTPVITVVAMKICSALFPRFIEPEHLNSLSIAGAFIVVAGSMICSLGRNNKV